MAANTSIMPTTPPIQSRVTSSSSIVILPVQALEHTRQQFSNHDDGDYQRQAFKENVCKHVLLPYRGAGLLCLGVPLQISRLSRDQQVPHQQDQQGHGDRDESIRCVDESEAGRQISERPQ